MKIILIMGLPGAGKTTLANELAKSIKAKRLNADEIRKCINKSLELNPENSHSICNLAQIEENEGNMERCKELYEKALESDPENVWIRNREAYFYWSISEFEQAKDCIEYTRTNFLPNGSTELIAAQIAHSTGNIEEAENICKNYLQRKIGAW